MEQLIAGLTKFIATSILVISLAACGGAEERKVKYLEKGKAYLAEKNYEKAKIEFKNVMQIDPKYAEAYFLMGQLEEKRKDLRKSLGNYKKVIELDPQHVDAKVNLAKIYVIAGTEQFIQNARELLAEVKLVQPDNSLANLVSATIEYKVGSKKKATKDLEALVSKDKNLTEGISLLSSIYRKEERTDDAVKLLTKGALDNPQNITIRMALAQTLARNGDYADAERFLKQAVSIEPEKYSLQVALSSFYATSNQLDKAEAVLRKSIEQDDEDAQRYLVLIELLSSRFNIQKAEDELKRAVQNKPDVYELKFALASFYKKIGKRDESKAVLKQIVADKSYDFEGVNARILLANDLLEEGDYKGAKAYVDEVKAEYPNNNDAILISSKLALDNLDAIAAINGLRTVVKNDPKKVEAFLLLAKAHELNGESSLAENELKKSIENNPINEQTHINYAHYLASKGRIDEALKVADKALAYFKDNYDLLAFKLQIVASQGDEKEVVSLLNILEQLNPGKAEINLSRGKYYLSKKETAKALEQFEKAYLKSRDKYKSLEFIVNTYMLNKQTDKAVSRLKTILDKNPDDATANQLLGVVYMSQKNMQDARTQFKRASKSAEAWLPPYISLAYTYLAEKNIDQAVKVYQGAISKLNNKVPVQMRLAALYEKQKQFDKSMEIYKQIIDKYSGNKVAANNLASLLLDYGTDADIPKALELSKSFEKLKQPAFLDTLGWAYVKSGDNIKAIEILKPIVKKAPEIAVFRYHLGYALYNSGDKAAAKSHLEVAAKSEQKYTGKDKVLDLLKTL